MRRLFPAVCFAILITSRVPIFAWNAALGVTDGALEGSIGAIDATADPSAILGSPLSIAATPSAYTDWTSFYIANRSSTPYLTLHKRTQLKATDTTANVSTPNPSLNLFLALRNNAKTPDQFWKNRLLFASIGQALTPAEPPGRTR